VTEVAPVAVHASSTIVGELHATGEAGDTTNPEIVGPPGRTVVTEPGAVVVVGNVLDAVEALDDEEVAIVVEIVVELLDALVVVAGGLAFLELLQAPRARIAANEARTSPMRATNGGYGDEPPYPGH
jgi:hypothetical protein